MTEWTGGNRMTASRRDWVVAALRKAGLDETTAIDVVLRLTLRLCDRIERQMTPYHDRHRKVERLAVQAIDALAKHDRGLAEHLRKRMEEAGL